MTYWHAVMHDDVFLIMNEGWAGAAKPRRTIEDKDRKLNETPDLVTGSGHRAVKYKMDLIPSGLIVARYFPAEQAKVDELNVAAEEASRALQDYIEEHAVEEGLLQDAPDNTGKVTKATATNRLKLARYEQADRIEIEALQHVIDLFNAESLAKVEAKQAQAELDEATLKQYAKLTEDDIKFLVIDDKWQSTIVNRIVSEVDSLTLSLAERISELGNRYAETVMVLDSSLSALESKMASHLATMGIR
jgi:type I restriction enzyme M protein